MLGTHFSWRVLATAVVLPAAIAGADQLGIDFANSRRWQGPATLLLFGGFMLQTAALSRAIGRWLPTWRWRFGVLAWALVLTNLLLDRAIIEGSDGSSWGGENPVLLLTTAFVAAQVSAVAVCFVLVLLSLGKKTLITGAALALLSTAVSGLIADVEFWATVMLIQVIATTLLAAVLRARGWQIVQLDSVNRASQGVWLQFSIRHMLVVTMAAALLTVFGKAVVIHSAAGMDWKHWLQGTIDGCALGVLSLVAVWAALGTGRATVRFALLLLLAMLLAGQLWWAEETAASMFLPAGGPMLSTTFWFRQALAGPWWFAWTLLAGTFLASWLSVLRATGYRLVRPVTGKT